MHANCMYSMHGYKNYNSYFKLHGTLHGTYNYNYMQQTQKCIIMCMSLHACMYVIYCKHIILQ